VSVLRHTVHCTCRRLKKDILVHLADMASEYRRKADANLAPTTKRLLVENYQLNSRVADMYDEIKLLQQQSIEWKAEDDRQIRHMRDLVAANADITNRNITIRMVHHTFCCRYFNCWLGVIGLSTPRKLFCNDLS